MVSAFTIFILCVTEFSYLVIESLVSFLLLYFYFIYFIYCVLGDFSQVLLPSPPPAQIQFFTVWSLFFSGFECLVLTMFSITLFMFIILSFVSSGIFPLFIYP